MKILHITNAYPCEQTPEYGVFVKEQLESLTALGVDNYVYFINGRHEGKRAYFAAIKWIRENARKYDVIHCHHVYSLIAFALSGIRDRPVVLSFLNDWLHEVKGRSLWPFRYVICNYSVRFANKVIFKSPIPVSLSSRKNVIHLPNGVDQNRFFVVDRVYSKASIGLDECKRYILFVSSKNQYRKQKRYDIFHSVVQDIKLRRPDLMIDELIMVNQPRDRVIHYFNSSDVHLLTSDYEGSPNSVKESLCCGTPVVSRSVGNVEQMLSGIQSCVVVKTHSINDISRALEKVLDAKIDRNKMREHFLSKGLTMDAVARELLSIYKSL